MGFLYPTLAAAEDGSAFWRDAWLDLRLTYCARDRNNHGTESKASEIDVDALGWGVDFRKNAQIAASYPLLRRVTSGGCGRSSPGKHSRNDVKFIVAYDTTLNPRNFRDEH